MREMKDSGIEWIGEIPEDWEVVRIKYIPNNEKDSFVDGDWIESPVITDFGIRYYTTGNVGDGCFKQQGDGYISPDTFRILNCKYAYPGDLIFSRLNAPYGRSCIIPDDYEEKCVLAVDIVILRTNEDKRFICYVTQCVGYQHSVEDKAAGTTMKRISRTNLGNVIIPLPKRKLQKTIADFLDSKCAEIDALIADIEKEIALLEEYKKSVITEAVTKGLDPSVEMKDSGIEWIGMIPKDWEVSKLGNVMRLRSEKNYKPLDQVNLISLYTDRGVVQHADLENTTGNKAQTAEGYKIVSKDNIVVNIILAWMGAMGISQYDGVTSPAYDVYELKFNKVVPHFCHYLLRTPAMAGECYKYGRGIMLMRWRTYSTEFKRIKMPLPPLLIQKQIAEYLDEKCSEIDSLIKEKQDQLTLLVDYKKSLIYEYVTGKKEVPANAEVS